MTAKRDTGRIASSPDGGNTSFAAQGFDPSLLFANPQRAAEAWIAASQSLLKGLQEISDRSLKLQAALMEQSLSGAAILLQSAQPGAKPEDAVASVQQATETTLESIREIMTTACKCSMDAVRAYRAHMAGDEPGPAGYGPSDRARAAGK
jgi:hypothetical protein